jgi:hypothetical protein
MVSVLASATSWKANQQHISRAFYYWGALGENPLVCRHKVLLLARVCTEAVQLLNYDMDLRFAVN